MNESLLDGRMVFFNLLCSLQMQPHRNIGNRNSATLAVARKIVAYLMAVDKNQEAFTAKEAEAA